MNERIEINRRNWNERTPIHASEGGYDVEGFKAGCITLTDIEIDEVGDVSGKSLLHLQCHFGMDTMSWARLGANATGIDLSDASIDLAQELNAETRVGPPRFIRSNVYDLPDVLDEEFDIVLYTGVRCAVLAARYGSGGDRLLHDTSSLEVCFTCSMNTPRVASSLASAERQMAASIWQTAVTPIFLNPRRADG